MSFREDAIQLIQQRCEIHKTLPPNTLGPFWFYRLLDVAQISYPLLPLLKTLDDAQLLQILKTLRDPVKNKTLV